MNYCDPEATVKVKQWDRQRQTYIKINCLTALQEYNKSMRGVDLADTLISLYRTTIKTKRQYLKDLFYCVNIAFSLSVFIIRHCPIQYLTKTVAHKIFWFFCDSPLENLIQEPSHKSKLRFNRDKPSKLINKLVKFNWV